jgi:sugar lactone lactonase YvrE
MKLFASIPTATILLSVALVTACSKGGSNPAPGNTPAGPAITSLNVNTGPYNTQVTINGTGFSFTTADDQVFFNGKAANIEEADATEIIADVPLAAGTGNVTVKVNGVTATGPVFTYQQALVITTFAGNKFQAGLTNGMGAAALFNELSGITIDKNGNLYVSDAANFVIRKVTPAGVVSTFAGSGKSGNADGAGTAASFTQPAGLAVDQAGNVFVTDAVSCLIRKITPDGTVSTVAGNGLPHANDGVGILASFSSPAGVAVDANDNLYIADTGNHEIRKITPDGTVTTIAGNADNPGTADGVGATASFTSPDDIIVGNDGNLYVTDGYQGPVRKITLPNTVSRIGASGLTSPQGLAMDAAGNIYVASTGSTLIQKIAPDGTTSTYAGNTGGTPLTDGVLSKASFGFPTGVAVDVSGNVFVADVYAIREITFQ